MFSNFIYRLNFKFKFHYSKKQTAFLQKLGSFDKNRWVFKAKIYLLSKALYMVIVLFNVHICFMFLLISRSYRCDDEVKRTLFLYYLFYNSVLTFFYCCCCFIVCENSYIFILALDDYYYKCCGSD
uniref:Uncharacterized protein n=1 Tax=Heterorhabditis bacteriophora TaxID=37862 RepID=A0A1I7WR39_HETBA